MIAALFSALVLAAPGSGARERIRFDADWRFLREPVAAESTQGPLVWQWKPALAVRLDAARLPDDLGAGDWRATRLRVNTLREGNTSAWYRTDLGNDPQGAAKVLRFESVDDNAVVFLNGQRLATQIGYGIPFEVPVRAAWHEGGPNSLVVLVENTDGAGGINGGVEFALPEQDRTPPEMAAGFDDSGWRTVHLPHDYVVEGTFDPNGDTGHGSLPKPIGLYRKTFTLPESMRGKSVWIDFDGVYRNSDVYLNGERLGHRSSGYMGFRYDLSKRLAYGKSNVLAVRVDPRRNEGWWYEGGGIYRHVWLNVADPVHGVPDGIFARATVGQGTAEVKVSAQVVNDGADATVDVHSEILDPKARAVGTLDAKDVVLKAGGSTNVVGTVTVKSPQLWDLDQPNLYRVVTTIRRGGQAIDAETAAFGIRTVRWDKDRGFLLNGRAVKLQGTCNHQDHAGVGIAMPDGLLEWRVRKLMEMGCNAYRTSHNPVAPELLDTCDRLGMLVLDETRHFGDTELPKSPSGTKADGLGELKAQVRRDRNHPSVIAWSVYNEEPLQGTPEGGALFAKIRAAVDALDGTRLCTGATNYGYERGIVDVTDLFGVNYNIGEYDRIHADHPDQPLFGSETASAVSTRGIYENDPGRGYVSAYDVNAPSWGATAEAAWKPIAERLWMAGAFVWTGFDYKGEPTPYGWPCVNSHFGSLDIAGFPKDSFYYYQSVWTAKPMVHLLPHWNWPANKGNVKVWAYSNLERVELFLNGRSLGAKNVPKYGHVEWDVRYEPGTLEARAATGAFVTARDRVETAGAPAALRLKTDRTAILADNEDLTVVGVEVVDSKGRVCPTASNEIRFVVEGAGTIGGVGNGDPSDHDPDKADHRKAFNGLCMALVQSNGQKGRITLRATSPGLNGTSLSLVASGGVISQ